MLGLIQVFGHGILVNVRLKSLYNPGLGAAVFLQLPLGIYYIWYIAANQLTSTRTYVIGFIVTIIAAIILFLLPIRLLRSRDSKYPFAEEEMYGFAREKIEKIMNS